MKRGRDWPIFKKRFKAFYEKPQMNVSRNKKRNFWPFSRVLYQSLGHGLNYLGALFVEEMQLTRPPPPPLPQLEYEKHGSK